jgi:hypothetical protein
MYSGLYYYEARYYSSKESVWLSVDPLWGYNPHMSSYAFVSNNPINRIDPLGLTDYEINGEIRMIDDGHNDVRINVSEKQFSSLQYKFNKGGSGYERYLNKLSVQNGYTTYSYEGSSLVVTGHKAGGDSYSDWSISNRAPNYSTIENTVRTLDAGVGSAVGQFGNINVGSNNKWYYRQKSGKIFNGNQYVSTTSAATKYAGVAKGAKIGGALTGVALGGYEVYQGYVQDGGHYGYNAQVQTVGAIGGIAGGLAGAEIGAEIGAGIGACFGGVGAVPGAIIGGLIGGAIGAWAGDYYGEQTAKAIVK